LHCMFPDKLHRFGAHKRREMCNKIIGKHTDFFLQGRHECDLVLVDQDISRLDTLLMILRAELSLHCSISALEAGVQT
jgi:hypothetical protein